MAKQTKGSVQVFPEVVSVFRSDTTDTARWTVSSGSTNRGDAWTDFQAHSIKVPRGNTELGKVIRGHELVHARISPNTESQLEYTVKELGIQADVLMSAEEVRVNAVAKLIGYDTDLLTDGSEKQSGINAAKDGSLEAHNSSILFGSALIGTKTFNTFLAGLKSGGKPEWATELRELQKLVKKILRNQSVKNLGSTDPSYRYDKLTVGFGYTIEIAKLIQKQIHVPQSQSGEGSGASGVKVPVGMGADSFAPLIFDETVKRDVQVKGALHRRKTARATGKRVLYPSRVLTDPSKRVFGQKQRATGGIVIIDCSGSMELDADDLDTLLDYAPSSLVVAYSHRPGSSGKPNAWILAERGKRVKEIPTVFNVGNGVDGPVLEYAIAKRKGKETIVWVCDGQVTSGGTDRPTENLTAVCGEIVDKHGILMTPSFSQAVKVLSNPNSAKGKVYGRVGYYLANKKPSKYRRV
mgnify:CR=1 FL=1